MTPNEQTIVTDHSQLISDLVVTARAAQSVLAQSSHEARASALQHAATLTKDCRLSIHNAAPESGRGGS